MLTVTAVRRRLAETIDVPFARVRLVCLAMHTRPDGSLPLAGDVQLMVVPCDLEPERLAEAGTTRAAGVADMQEL